MLRALRVTRFIPRFAPLRYRRMATTPDLPELNRDERDPVFVQKISTSSKSTFYYIVTRVYKQVVSVSGLKLTSAGRSRRKGR